MQPSQTRAAAATVSTPQPAPAGRAKNARKAFWTKQMHLWHWVSAAICLVGMLLFSITGITLNHAGSISAEPQIETGTLQLPEHLLANLQQGKDGAALPAETAAWLRAQTPLRVRTQAAEWSEDEIYLALPRPGGDGWLSIDRHSGAVEFERSDRGVVSYLNDLHKGRHTGAAWSLFIDLFAVACLIFCGSGLYLLYLHAGKRRSTWPLVVAGFALPALLAVLFIH